MKKAFLIIIAAILLIPTIAKAQNNNGYITAEPDPEAVRVLRLMPKWKPGKTHKAGEPGLKVVRCQFSLPIVFEL